MASEFSKNGAAEGWKSMETYYIFSLVIAFMNFQQVNTASIYIVLRREREMNCIAVGKRLYSVCDVHVDVS